MKDLILKIESPNNPSDEYGTIMICKRDDQRTPLMSIRVTARDVRSALDVGQYNHNNLTLVDAELING